MHCCLLRLCSYDFENLLFAALQLLPIHVAAFDILLLTGAKTPDADIAAVLKVLEENFAALQKDYPQLRTGDAKKLALPTNTVPYHPGAIAYFKSRGMWTPANEEREKGFK